MSARASRAPSWPGDRAVFAWSQQRYEVGVEIVLDDQWRLEPHYLRQDDQRSSPAHVNAFGLILKYYR